MKIIKIHLYNNFFFHFLKEKTDNNKMKFSKVKLQNEK